MKVFGSIPRDDLGKIPPQARWVEAMGYDGINTNEDFSSPFMALTMAAEHTSKAILGTSIAVVFPLSPMNVAYMSWELQKFSQGRFRLGMGSQVKDTSNGVLACHGCPPVHGCGSTSCP